MSDRMRGTVTRVIAVRGFAFVDGDDGQHYFMHVKSLPAEELWANVRVGVRVEFAPIEIMPGRWRTEGVMFL